MRKMSIPSRMRGKEFGHPSSQGRYLNLSGGCGASEASYASDMGNNKPSAAFVTRVILQGRLFPY